MAHGTQDQVIALAWAEHSRDLLEAGGWPLEWRAYPMDHAAVIEELAAAGAFIERVLSD